MAAAGFLKSVYLRYLSKPAHQRQLFSLIKRNSIHRIVELGIGDGQRAVRMIEMAQRYHDSEINYAGIDLFEARSEPQPGLPLKQAYKQLRATGAKVQLIPGDPYSSLARAANSLGDTQLLIIAAGEQDESLERAWFYVPRMLAPEAIVLVESVGDENAKAKYQRLSRVEIERLAGAKQQRKRAA